MSFLSAWTGTPYFQLALASEFCCRKPAISIVCCRLYDGYSPLAVLSSSLLLCWLSRSLYFRRGQQGAKIEIKFCILETLSEIRGNLVHLCEGLKGCRKVRNFRRRTVSIFSAHPTCTCSTGKCCNARQFQPNVTWSVGSQTHPHCGIHHCLYTYLLCSGPPGHLWCQ